MTLLRLQHFSRMNLPDPSSKMAVQEEMEEARWVVMRLYNNNHNFDALQF